MTETQMTETQKRAYEKIKKNLTPVDVDVRHNNKTIALSVKTPDGQGFLIDMNPEGALALSHMLGEVGMPLLMRKHQGQKQFRGEPAVFKGEVFIGESQHDP